jgi:hypothetical protein
MKKIALLFIIGMSSIVFYSTIAQAELSVREEKFIQTIAKDFEGTHNIDLNSYHFFDFREIQQDNESLTNQEKSLTDIFMSISRKQNFVDCSPIFLIDKTNSNGYVLEKELNGMNTLHILSYDNSSQNWKVTNKINKMGTGLDKLGLTEGTK